MRSPGLATALLFTVAVGVGSNAVVYGFVRGLTARDAPLAATDRVVSLFARDSGRPTGQTSYEDFQSIRSVEAFEWAGTVRESQSPVVAQGGRTSIMSVGAVTAEVARLFDLRLDNGVVISHRVWQLEFGGMAQVRGQPVRVDGLDTHVGGVAPEDLEGVYRGRLVDVWMPLREDALRGAERSSRTFWILARLRPGASTGQAQAAVQARRNGSGEMTVLRYTGLTPEFADGLARVGALLGVAAGAVFLVACANVASLLLGRASARSHEISVRVALGAGRRQLARQLLADSLLVSLTGGALGVLLASWTSHIVPAFFFEQDAEQLALAPDRLGIAAASAACIGIMIACGLAPLLEVRHDRPAAVLQRENAGPSRRMRHLRAGLVVAQMAACCVLVISAGLLVQGLRTALQTTVRHSLGQPVLATVFARPYSGLSYFRDVEDAALSVAGFSETAWAGRLPGSPPAWQSVHIEPPLRPFRDATMNVVVFTPESLELVVLPPIEGRMFGGRDSAHTCRVAIVNKEAAAEVFGGQAVGRSIEDAAGGRVEIVGMVATRPEKDAATRTRPTIYYYADQVGTSIGQEGPARFRVPAAPLHATAVLDANVVSPDYFDAMGFSIAAGGVFQDGPATGSCRTAVVNQEAAERYFDGTAVGAAVIDVAGQRTEIIGVVHSPPLGVFQRPAEPAIYFPMAQDAVPGMTLILGAREAHDAMVAEVRRRVEAVPGRGRFPPVVTTLDEHLSRTALAPLRIATVLVGASATMALALGALGLYGALSDAGRRRRREVALRIALGAQGWRVIRQVVGDGGRLAGAGVVAGMLGSLVAARLLSRITPIDIWLTAWVWLAAPLALAAIVSIASVFPARRALSVDPLTIMRDT
jgi:predicted permease